jgi:hypothetical protein
VSDTPEFKGDFYVGYRAWCVEDDGKLLSTNRHYEWPTGDIKAECNPPSRGMSGLREGPHPVPSLDCECGIYAYYNIRADRVRYGELMGVIQVWGDIMLHNERLRAQFARVAGLLIPTEFQRPADGDTDDHAELMRKEWKRIDAAIAKYKIPLIQKKEPEEAEKYIEAEFGRHVPHSELPKNREGDIKTTKSGDEE